MISQEDYKVAGEINKEAGGEPEVEIIKNIQLAHIIQQLMEIHKNINDQRKGNKTVPDGIEQAKLPQHQVLYQQVK
jgi:hypothetical protein